MGHVPRGDTQETGQDPRGGHPGDRARPEGDIHTTGQDPRGTVLTVSERQERAVGACLRALVTPGYYLFPLMPEDKQLGNGQERRFKCYIFIPEYFYTVNPLGLSSETWERWQALLRGRRRPRRSLGRCGLPGLPAPQAHGPHPGPAQLPVL